MKCFFIGMGGALVLLLIAAVLIPLYSDYRALSETRAWLAQVQPIKAIIEESAARSRTLHGVAIEVDKESISIDGTDLFEVNSAGTIILRGGREGQTVILIPELRDGNLIWKCIGGPAKAVPNECRP